MKRFVLLPVALLCQGCIQMSQQAAEPIPPPAPETRVRPLPKELLRYYTLPRPIAN
ncbi:MAG: hypothetical protein IKJ29_08870 [Akkermansia sp.]|nr:hypothetical protein [Akkermansia sp.]